MTDIQNYFSEKQNLVLFYISDFLRRISRFLLVRLVQFWGILYILHRDINKIITFLF